MSLHVHKVQASCVDNFGKCSWHETETCSLCVPAQTLTCLNASNLSPFSLCKASIHVQVGQDCQLYGLKFIWVVNGTATRSQTAALAEDVRRSGISVHHWIVDQFASQEYPGTPEWSESASGQMKVLVDGLY